jgi:hypothetical protein
MDWRTGRATLRYPIVREGCIKKRALLCSYKQAHRRSKMAELLVERRASVLSVSRVGPQSRRGSVSADGDASSASSVSNEASHTESGGAFHLKHKCVLVKWSRSRIEDSEEFHRKLVELLPAGSELYGCQERHQDGNLHYHVVVRLEIRPNWRDAGRKFSMVHADGDVDTRAVRIKVPWAYQRQGRFLEYTEKYYKNIRRAKFFGERIEVVSMGKTRKRQFAEVASEPDLSVTNKHSRYPSDGECVVGGQPSHKGR